jgi:hypothetical protein
MRCDESPQVHIRYRHWIFKLPFMRRYRGMVVGRTVLFKGSELETSEAMLRHELIHQEQMDRHGVMRFYSIWFCDYLANLWRLRNHNAAYRNIPFEKEAYERERR